MVSAVESSFCSVPHKHLITFSLDGPTALTMTEPLKGRPCETHILTHSFSLFIALRFIYLQYVMNKLMDKTMNRIKEVLEEKGIKQTWLAEKLGKSFCIVNSYVCNRRQPSLEVLFEIAKILQVDPKELIDSNENK